MCFASSVYKSVYCGSVDYPIIMSPVIFVYRSPTTSLFCAEFFSLVGLITGSVSHIWSIYHSKKQLQLFG